KVPVELLRRILIEARALGLLELDDRHRTRSLVLANFSEGKNVGTLVALRIDRFPKRFVRGGECVKCQDLVDEPKVVFFEADVMGGCLPRKDQVVDDVLLRVLTISIYFQLALQ